MSYTTGDPEISIHSEKDVTPEFILNEANTIWKKYKKLKIPIADYDKIDTASSDLRKQHREFCTSYPIVFRFMCQLNSYSPKAFERYLKLIQQRPWKSENDYLESQVDYIILLYKAKNPRWDNNTISNLRRETLATLVKENEDFKRGIRKFYDEVNSMELKLKEKSLKELSDFCSREPEEIANEVLSIIEQPITVQDVKVELPLTANDLLG